MPAITAPSPAFRPSSFTFSQLFRAVMLIMALDTHEHPVCESIGGDCATGSRPMTCNTPDGDFMRETSLMQELRAMLDGPFDAATAGAAGAPARTVPTASAAPSARSSLAHSAATSSEHGEADFRDAQTGYPIVTVVSSPDRSPGTFCASLPAVEAVRGGEVTSEAIRPVSSVRRTPSVSSRVSSRATSPGVLLEEPAHLPGAPKDTSARNPFSPRWNVNRPFIAPPSDSPSWYVVSVGRRIGVFDNNTMAIRCVQGVPNNASVKYSSRDAAIVHFAELQTQGLTEARPFA